MSQQTIQQYHARAYESGFYFMVSASFFIALGLGIAYSHHLTSNPFIVLLTGFVSIIVMLGGGVLSLKLLYPYKGQGES